MNDDRVWEADLILSYGECTDLLNKSLCFNSLAYAASLKDGSILLEYLHPETANELIDFITELVHHIADLEGENIRLFDEIIHLQDTYGDRIDADSANYISPGNWGGYT